MKRILLISVILVAMILSGCAVPVTTSTPQTVTITVTPSSFATHNSSSTIIAHTSNTTQTQITPMYDATIIKLHAYNAGVGYPDTYGVLFTNNANYTNILTCTIRQRNPDGSFLSNYDVKSDYPIPPNSHYIEILPSNTITGTPSIINLAATLYTYSSYPRVSFTNLKIVTNNSTNENFDSLSGTLNNINENVTPVSTQLFLDIQVLKRTTDNSLTLAGSYSTGLIINLPPGEFSNLSIPLGQDVTIEDAQNGIIDGEITIIAWNAN